MTNIFAKGRSRTVSVSVIQSDTLINGFPKTLRGGERVKQQLVPLRSPRAGVQLDYGDQSGSPVFTVWRTDYNAGFPTFVRVGGRKMSFDATK